MLRYRDALVGSFAASEASFHFLGGQYVRTDYTRKIVVEAPILDLAGVPDSHIEYL